MEENLDEIEIEVNDESVMSNDGTTTIINNYFKDYSNFDDEKLKQILENNKNVKKNVDFCKKQKERLSSSLKTGIQSSVFTEKGTYRSSKIAKEILNKGIVYTITVPANITQTTLTNKLGAFMKVKQAPGNNCYKFEPISINNDNNSNVATETSLSKITTLLNSQDNFLGVCDTDVTRAKTIVYTTLVKSLDMTIEEGEKNLLSPEKQKAINEILSTRKRDRELKERRQREQEERKKREAEKRKQEEINNKVNEELRKIREEERQKNQLETEKEKQELEKKIKNLEKQKNNLEKALSLKETSLKEKINELSKKVMDATEKSQKYGEELHKNESIKNDYKDLNEKYDELKRSYNVLQKKYKDQEFENTSLKGDIEAEKNKNKDIASQILLEQEKKRTALTKAQQDAEKEMLEFRKKIRDNEQTINDLKRQAKNAQNVIKAKEELEEENRKIKDEQEKIKKSNKELEEKTKKEKEEMEKSYKIKLKEAEDKQKELENTNQQKNKEIEDIKNKHNKELEDAKNKQKQMEETNKNKIKELEEKYQNSRKEIQNQANTSLLEINKLKKQLQKEQDKQKEMEETNENKNKELEDIKKQKEELEEKTKKEKEKMEEKYKELEKKTKQEKEELEKQNTSKNQEFDNIKKEKEKMEEKYKELEKKTKQEKEELEESYKIKLKEAENKQKQMEETNNNKSQELETKYQKEIEKVKKELEKTKDKQKEIENQNTTKNKELEDIKKQKEELEEKTKKEKEKMEEKYKELEKKTKQEKEELEKQNTSKNQEFDNIKKEKEKMEEKYKELEKKTKQEKEELEESYKIKLKEAENKQKQMEETNNNKSQELETKYQKEIDEIKKQKEELEKKTKQEKEELEKANENKSQELETKYKEKLEEEQTKHKEEIEKVKKELETQNTTKNQELETKYQEEIKALEEKYNTQIKEINNQSEISIIDVNKEKQQLEDKIKELELQNSDLKTLNDSLQSAIKRKRNYSISSSDMSIYGIDGKKSKQQDVEYETNKAIYDTIKEKLQNYNYEGTVSEQLGQIKQDINGTDKNKKTQAKVAILDIINGYAKLKNNYTEEGISKIEAGDTDTINKVLSDFSTIVKNVEQKIDIEEENSIMFNDSDMSEVKSSGKDKHNMSVRVEGSAKEKLDEISKVPTKAEIYDGIGDILDEAGFKEETTLDKLLSMNKILTDAEDGKTEKIEKDKVLEAYKEIGKKYGKHLDKSLEKEVFEDLNLEDCKQLSGNYKKTYNWIQLGVQEEYKKRQEKIAEENDKNIHPEPQENKKNNEQKDNASKIEPKKSTKTNDQTTETKKDGKENKGNDLDNLNVSSIQKVSEIDYDDEEQFYNEVVEQQRKKDVDILNDMKNDINNDYVNITDDRKEIINNELNKPYTKFANDYLENNEFIENNGDNENKTNIQWITDQFFNRIDTNPDINQTTRDDVYRYMANAMGMNVGPDDKITSEDVKEALKKQEPATQASILQQTEVQHPYLFKNREDIKKEKNNKAKEIFGNLKGNLDFASEAQEKNSEAFRNKLKDVESMRKFVEDEKKAFREEHPIIAFFKDLLGEPYNKTIALFQRKIKELSISGVAHYADNSNNLEAPVNQAIKGMQDSITASNKIIAEQQLSDVNVNKRGSLFTSEIATNIKNNLRDQQKHQMMLQNKKDIDSKARLANAYRKVAEKANMNNIDNAEENIEIKREQEKLINQGRKMNLSFQQRNNNSLSRVGGNRGGSNSMFQRL